MNIKHYNVGYYEYNNNKQQKGKRAYINKDIEYTYARNNNKSGTYCDTCGLLFNSAYVRRVRKTIGSMSACKRCIEQHKLQLV